MAKPTDDSNAVYIPIDDIYIGLYVHLDLGWLEHDFARSSFRIKNVKEIAEIKSLGKRKIRVDPTLSAIKPSPPPVQARETPPEAEVAIATTPEALEQHRIKLRRVERLNQLHTTMAQCKKQFLQASKALKNISLNLFPKPQEARKDADQLVQQMMDSMLKNKDVAIHLLNEKDIGEDNYYHSLNVAMLAMLLGKELAMSDNEIKLLGLGSLFHDIGKIEIPDWLVQKKTPHTTVEKNLLQQHCQYGVPIVNKLALPQAAIDVVLQHHENIDGSGFPNGLKGDQISKLARIIAIVNVYDNHCNRPNPSDSLSPAEALSTMFARQRALFDTEPLNAFIQCMGVYPPGTIVRLSDDSIGIVISGKPGLPLRPSVLIYNPSVPKEEAMILDLVGEPEINVVASIKPKDLEPEVYAYLNPRKRMMYFFDARKPTEGAHG